MKNCCKCDLKGTLNEVSETYFCKYHQEEFTRNFLQQDSITFTGVEAEMSHLIMLVRKTIYPV